MTNISSGSVTVQSPPALGERQSWRFRIIEWCERNEDDPKNPHHLTAMVPSGMAVHENLHPYYWEARGNYEKVIASWRNAGKPMPRGFILTDKGDQVVGGGLFHPADGSHEMAWQNCMFAEMRGWRVSVELPEGLTKGELDALCPRVGALVEKDGGER